MRRLILTLLAVPLLLTLALESAQAEWFYADLANPPTQLILSDTEITFYGQRAPLTFCQPESDFLCFSGGGLRFSVPKDSSYRATWTYDSASYKITRREKFSMLGRELDVIFIEQRLRKDRMMFLFSPTRGLVAIISSSAPTLRMLLLENPCGFGAPPGCQ